MSILLNKDKTELIVTCNCGCDRGVHIKIDDEDKEYGYYAFVSFMNGNFYKDQYGAFDILKEKFAKIWAIIRNKDYYYSDVIMTKDDFKQFKEYVNSFEIEE